MRLKEIVMVNLYIYSYLQVVVKSWPVFMRQRELHVRMLSTQGFLHSTVLFLNNTIKDIQLLILFYLSLQMWNTFFLMLRDNGKMMIVLKFWELKLQWPVKEKSRITGKYVSGYEQLNWESSEGAGHIPGCFILNLTSLFPSVTHSLHVDTFFLNKWHPSAAKTETVGWSH